MQELEPSLSPSELLTRHEACLAGDGSASAGLSDKIANANANANANAVNAAYDGIISVDEQQRIVLINPAALRMFGCSADEAIGSCLARFIPAEYRERHADQLRNYAARPQPTRAMSERGELFALRANGDRFPVAVTISQAIAADHLGLPRTLCTALVRDLSVEQDLRSELADMKHQFRRLFELAPIAMLITEDDTIVFANRSCLALLGASRPEQIIGRAVFELLHDDSHAVLKQQMQRALRVPAGSLCILSEQITRLDGGLRKVEIAIATLPGAHRSTVQMVLSDITEQEHASLELQQSRHELRRLSASLIDAREEERRRIARELHDELGQRLSALKMELAQTGKDLHGRAIQSRIHGMLDMLDETVASVRHIATDLRPLMLDDLGLNAAIEWLAREYASRMDIEITVRLDEDEPQMEPRMATALYRMVQEALTNVGRHACATDVQIELRVDGRELALTIQDNGIGFPVCASRKENSFGLLGMRERAFLLQGQMLIDNPPGGGGRIRIRLPLPTQLSRQQLQAQQQQKFEQELDQMQASQVIAAGRP
ncbi:PAS domain-containing sensor histidine kinase [Roseateles oligotrophus]|uniref:PAS domain-containing sensor histidine kinase n=1 Tax=Roseateles oligotrophus TaxID=1769250 RepID=A0ABT2YMM6_9BURK|nr:PAS domain-containing sensor histidine kinase [Roseateles oligotrophus]MCV2371325.1 PAS domain-containing sensor histidine kinase [Roseateles oligotrophus]